MAWVKVSDGYLNLDYVARIEVDRNGDLMVLPEITSEAMHGRKYSDADAAAIKAAFDQPATAEDGD